MSYHYDNQMVTKTYLKQSYSWIHHQKTYVSCLVAFLKTDLYFAETELRTQTHCYFDSYSLDFLFFLQDDLLLFKDRDHLLF